MNDTICAIATSQGIGAIAIIRVSGEDAIEIVSKIWKGKNLQEQPSHTIHYGHIVDGEEVIDEVLLSLMKGPKTFTTEDIIEINCHGGIQTTKKILELLIENGCRLAEPGEFTKRAFLNGRIDLSQAEAVIDIINSKTDKELKISVNQLEGNLSKTIKEIRSQIISMMADIEATIDYPEYDIEEITNNRILENLEEVEKKIRKIRINV